MAESQERHWQVGKSVLDCNLYMLENKLFTDVTFEVGPEAGHTEQIAAHKYVLVSRSPVFEAMFCGLMREDTRNMVRITDVDPSAFQDTLR